MIFVTVGTHEQPFDRLISEVDRLIAVGEITDEVVMQTGYCTYVPTFGRCSKFFTYDEMEYFMERAEIVICHGGPATFMSVINKGKVPIVVPRQKKYAEHVNDHQLEFAEKVMSKGYHLEIATVDELISSIKGYQLEKHDLRTRGEGFIHFLTLEIKSLFM